MNWLKQFFFSVENNRNPKKLDKFKRFSRIKKQQHEEDQISLNIKIKLQWSKTP